MANKGQTHLQSGEGLTLAPWKPAEELQSIDPLEVHYSRGFLRCTPEKWFPGFEAQWLPLAHSLGVEFRTEQVKPSVSALPDTSIGFAGTVDDEPIGLFIAPNSARVLVDAVIPQASEQARLIILEYLARRLLTSLAISWSGPESSVIQFEPDLSIKAIRGVGTIECVVTINGALLTITILLGKQMVARLDGLWRRQLQSTAKQGQGNLEVRLEVAHLAVSPNLLGDYLQPGTAIDLEAPVSDTLTLVTAGATWLAAKLRTVENVFGIEVSPGSVKSSALPEGTTRLSIELGGITLDPILATELTQPGAIYNTNLPLSDQVLLMVNQEQVGEAVLRVYQGRFVASVM